MPRNASGNYTLPEPPVVPGNTILAVDENSTRSDMATEITSSLDRSGRGGMLAALRLFDGTITVPGLAFVLETGSGLYRVSAGVWAAAVLGVRSAQFLGVVNGVNYAEFVPAIATAHPEIRAGGSDANINMRVMGKGTGRGVLGNMTTARLAGRFTAANGDSEEISLGQGLKVTSLVLKNEETAQVLTFANPIVWDTDAGRVAEVTLTASTAAMGAPSNMVEGGTYALHIIQDGTGNRTLTSWNAVFKWPLGIVPVLTTAAGARDLFFFHRRGANIYGSHLKDVK